MEKHPAFVRAESLQEPLRSHFPKSIEEATNWKPLIQRRALSFNVLAVARTRRECAWAAYIDAVPGIDHELEGQDVLDNGTKLQEDVARALFPIFRDVPYAD